MLTQKNTNTSCSRETTICNTNGKYFIEEQQLLLTELFAALYTVSKVSELSNESMSVCAEVQTTAAINIQLNCMNNML